MASSVRAAPEGDRRPCSQSCSVLTDIPSNSAKRACDKPTFSRTEATSGRLTMRPYSSRLSSRSPSRISRPISRCSSVIFHVGQVVLHEPSKQFRFDKAVHRWIIRLCRIESIGVFSKSMYPRNRATARPPAQDGVFGFSPVRLQSQASALTPHATPPARDPGSSATLAIARPLPQTRRWRWRVL